MKIDKICCFLLIVILFSCSKNIKANRIGVFEIMRNDSLITYLKRDNYHQLEYITESEKKPKESIIEWSSNNSYSLEVLNPKNKFDSLYYQVKIDSIIKDTFYESIYLKGLKIKIHRKMVKLKDLE